MPAHRKYARLSPDRYRGRQSYFLTLCTDRRFPHLADQSASENVQRILTECAGKHSFVLHAFCVMPDHVHILAAGIASTSDAREFIHLFKQRTAFEFRRTNNARYGKRATTTTSLGPRTPSKASPVTFGGIPSARICAAILRGFGSPALKPSTGFAVPPTAISCPRLGSQKHQPKGWPLQPHLASHAQLSRLRTGVSCTCSGWPSGRFFLRPRCFILTLRIVRLPRLFGRVVHGRVRPLWRAHRRDPDLWARRVEARFAAWFSTDRSCT